MFPFLYLNLNKYRLFSSIQKQLRPPTKIMLLCKEGSSQNNQLSSPFDPKFLEKYKKNNSIILILVNHLISLI